MEVRISRRALIAIAAVFVVAAATLAVRAGIDGIGWRWDEKARRDADDACQKAFAEALGELPNPAESVEELDWKENEGLLEDPALMVVEPGTEILFELNHPVRPYVNYFDHPEINYIGDGAWLIPPPTPRDGKWRPIDGFCRWSSGFCRGLLWATDRHILYVAPGTPGMFDPICLSAMGSLHHPDRLIFRLAIMTSGGKEPVDKLIESQGCRIDEVPRDTWWGYGGGIRLRPVYWRKAPPELQWSTGEWIEVDYGDLEEPRAPAEQPDGRRGRD